MIRDITIHWGIFLAFWDGMKILPVGIGCLGEQPNWNQHCVLLQVSDTCHLPCLFCAPWNVASAPRMCSLKVAITCSYPFYGFLWQFLLAQYIYDHLVPLLVTSTWYGPQMWDPKWTDLLWRSFQLCDFFGPCWTSQKWKRFHLPLYHPKKQMIPNHESNWSKIATSIHEYPLVLFKIISQPPQVFDDWKKHHTSCVICGNRNSNRPRPQSGRASLNINAVLVPRRFNWQKMRVLPSNNMQKYTNVRYLKATLIAYWSKLGTPKY